MNMFETRAKARKLFGWSATVTDNGRNHTVTLARRVALTTELEQLRCAAKSASVLARRIELTAMLNKHRYSIAHRSGILGRGDTWAEAFNEASRRTL